MSKMRREHSMSQQMSEMSTIQSMQLNANSALAIKSHLSGGGQHQRSRYSEPKQQPVHDNYYKHLAYQKREGRIRLVNQIGSSSEANSSSTRIGASSMHVSTLDEVKKQQKRRFATVNHSIDVKHRRALNYTSDPYSDHNSTTIAKREHNTTSTVQNSLERVVVRDLPPSLRYLTRHGETSPKEKPKDTVLNIRSMFYTQLSIDNKREETLKLREYIIMEQEKLEEARKVFDEDKEKFHKYLTEMENQADIAKTATEAAVHAKQEVNGVIDQLQQEIAKYERELLQVEEESKQSLVHKVFIEAVVGQRRFRAKKANIANKDANFFITEEAQHIFSGDQGSNSVDSLGIAMEE